ncbi:MAG TPA: response regulator transcription factor [Bacillota bacterium]|nr:response regulator transcription factor [Bacillota bacterium]HPE38715.1 response regulator transcription factor [Bacillota bacterium]
MKKTIYIADDDGNIRNLVRTFLEREGYVVNAFEDGESLLRFFSTNPSDMVILDVMMPGRDGFFICNDIRKMSNVPIIMLTARDSDADYISGLSLGSDDYFTKPFSPVKLVSKVKAIFRRIDTEDDTPHNDQGNISFEDIEIMTKTKIVTWNNEELQLTPNEYALLTYMILNKDRAVSRVELLDRIWGYETEVETRVADDTVKRLRKKLTKTNVIIKTVWGYGFRLHTKSEDTDDAEDASEHEETHD